MARYDRLWTATIGLRNRGSWVRIPLGVPDLHSGRGRFVLRDVQDMLCNSQITDTGITRTCHGEHSKQVGTLP